MESPSKIHKFIKSKTAVAQYEIYTSPINSPNLRIYHTQISKKLMPHCDQIEKKGTRIERLKQLLEKQDWFHLTANQKKQLSQIVLTHNTLFMLDERDLGTISSEPAHISVADNNPCRSPMY